VCVYMVYRVRYLTLYIKGSSNGEYKGVLIPDIIFALMKGESSKWKDLN